MVSFSNFPGNEYFRYVADYMTGTVGPAVDTAMESVRDTVGPAVDTAMESVRDTVGPAVDTAMESTKNMVNSAVQFVAEHPNGMSAAGFALSSAFMANPNYIPSLMGDHGILRRCLAITATAGWAFSGYSLENSKESLSSTAALVHKFMPFIVITGTLLYVAKTLVQSPKEGHADSGSASKKAKVVDSEVLNKGSELIGGHADSGSASKRAKVVDSEVLNKGSELIGGHADSGSASKQAKVVDSEVLNKGSELIGGHADSGSASKQAKVVDSEVLNKGSELIGGHADSGSASEQAKVVDSELFNGSGKSIKGASKKDRLLSRLKEQESRLISTEELLGQIRESEQSSFISQSKSEDLLSEASTDFKAEETLSNVDLQSSKRSSLRASSFVPREIEGQGNAPAIVNRDHTVLQEALSLGLGEDGAKIMVKAFKKARTKGEIQDKT